MEDREYSNVYAIPANYTDSGKLFGGMVDTRNAVEAVLLLAAVGAPELFWIPMSGTIRVVVMTVTLIPLGVVAVMGVDGGSLFSSRPGRSLNALNVAATCGLLYNASLMVEEGVGSVLCLDGIINASGDRRLCFRPP